MMADKSTPQDTLTVTHQQAKYIPRGAMTVLRPTIKDQKVNSGPIPGNLCPLPQNSWNNPPIN